VNNKLARSTTLAAAYVVDHDLKSSPNIYKKNKKINKNLHPMNDESMATYGQRRTATIKSSTKEGRGACDRKLIIIQTF
jgi:hypothetical protein